MKVSQGLRGVKEAPIRVFSKMEEANGEFDFLTAKTN
jgi:hypothetical protein